MSDQGESGGAGGEKGPKTRRGRVNEGIRDGIGVLSAFKDAIEETIQEARDRGDLSTDRAKEVMKDALGRAQAAAEGARERLDFAHQTDLEVLARAVDGLRARLVSLEASVFGETKGGSTPNEEPPAPE